MACHLFTQKMTIYVNINCNKITYHYEIYQQKWIDFNKETMHLIFI